MKGVVAFGNSHDMLEVWVDADIIGQHETTKLFTKVKDPCTLKFVRYTPATKKIKPGDKLFRVCHGTVGMFAKGENDLIGITISHVTNGKKELYVTSDAISQDRELRQLGNVIKLNESERSYEECVSFIRVHDSERHRIQPQLEKEEKLLNSSLCTENDNLADIRQKVFKKGAVTGWTEGIVKFAKHPLPESIIIEGTNGEFCKKGDSGSAIVRLEPNDPDTDKVEIISILSGFYEDRDQSEIKGTHTYTLKEPLDKLSRKSKTKYSFE
ncbi:hypothetical protein FSP39_021699 [Pinctada imbricata]|uniref:Uncharacterized protein n=1 Tax=Pinctada imbricata TaxID=66713 RepID=A0AA88YPD0_PINIB|nr:hypothetical protein FSP39_021699 [Pinctada imbricata]